MQTFDSLAGRISHAVNPLLSLTMLNVRLTRDDFRLIELLKKISFVQSNVGGRTRDKIEIDTTTIAIDDFHVA